MFSYFKDRKFLQATALLVCTMVGVGIFGIPFAFAKAGFWLGTAWLIALAVLTGLYDLMFAELALRTQGAHQISGYANIYLGPWARRTTSFALILSGYGALLAYMIIVGGFLHNILSQYIAINPDWYAIIFALAWSVLVMARLRTVAAVDLFMLGLFGITVIAVALFAVPHIQTANFQGITREFWFLPYGILMFALSGANAIPMQRQLLAGREKLLRPAIITAVVVVALLYLAFAFAVVGVTGDVTTPDALGGLYDIMGQGLVLLGSVFGILTISTAFLMMGTTMYEMFHIDYKVHKLLSWLLVIIPPVFFFWTGLRNFIDIIGLIGSVAVGLLTLVILAAYLRGRSFRLREPEFAMRIHRFAVWALMLVFAAGIAYAVFVQ